MSYRMRRFLVPLSANGPGNKLVDQLNQFLSLNQFLTVGAVTVSFRSARGRGTPDAVALTILWRAGGARQYAVEFVSNPAQTAEEQLTAFFSLNSSFVATKIAVVSAPENEPRNRRVLAIYQNSSYMSSGCRLEAAPGAPCNAVAIGAQALFYDIRDSYRPGLLAMNLGNVAWPDGGTNLLFRSIKADTGLCAYGGVAPGCYAGAGIDCGPAPVTTQICVGCIDAALLTLTLTNTGTTAPGTTTTVTFPPPPTSTSTTTPPSSTTSTTSTTTTPPPACCLRYRYFCIWDGANSSWFYGNGECVPAADCGGASTECGDGVYTFVDADGCACGQVITEADCPAPGADCPASCSPNTCTFTWESVFNCATGFWGTPYIVATACDTASASDWAPVGYNPCVQRKVTKGSGCTSP